MKQFIENFLHITDYTLYYFDSGKNNITAKVEYREQSVTKSFVLQKEESHFKKDEKHIICQTVTHMIDHGLCFADKYFDQRFYHYEGVIYQAMQYIQGETLTMDQIDNNILPQLAQYLGKYHILAQNIPYTPTTNDPTFKDIDSMITKAINHTHKTPQYQKKLEKIIQIKEQITLNTGLPTGVIHGDPAFKNYLFDPNKKVVGLIDYEKMEVGCLIRDLTDLMRSCLKIKRFAQEEYDLIIQYYQKERTLTQAERDNLSDYLIVMILNTATQYYLSLFPESDYANHLGGEADSLAKIDRCFHEIEKVKRFV